MFCKYCGYDIVEGNICPNCGKENIEEVIKEDVIDKTSDVNEPINQNSKKSYDVFAKVSYISGIVTFVASFLTCGLFIIFSIASLIFSCLGKKSTIYRHKADIGFKLSLASTIISAILLTVLIICCIVFGILVVVGAVSLTVIMGWIIIK